MRLFINTGCDLRKGIDALILVTDEEGEGLKELRSFALERGLTTPVYTGEGRWVCLPIMNIGPELCDGMFAELAARLFGDKKRRVLTVEAVPGGGSILEIQ